MNWNYRVICKTNNNISSYCIHEVYYDKNKKPILWSENSTSLYSEENLKNLINNINLIKKALDKPILNLIKNKDGKEFLIELK